MVHTPEIKAGDIDFLTVFPDGTLLKSASGEILYVNPAFLEMAKLDKQDLIGHYFADIEWKDSHYALFGKKEMEQALALEARLIATPEMHHTSEIYRKQFNTVESWVKIRALFLADKQQYLFFCQDVAHHKHFFSAVLPLTTELPEDELSDMLQHHVKETERLREQAEKASAELLVRVEEKERMERQLQDYIEHVQMAQFEAMKAKAKRNM